MRRLVGALVGLLFLAGSAGAQDFDGLELKAIIGTSGFLDEVTDYYPVVGAAARVSLTPAFAIEPEFTYLRASSRHQDYAFQTAVIWQVRRGRLAPYLLAAGGVRHSQFRFPGALQERFSSNEFTGGGGIGMRIGLGHRFRLSPEVRFGWEPIVRATVSLGYAPGPPLRPARPSPR